MLAKVEAETEPPPDENDGAVTGAGVGVGVGVTGLSVHVTETLVTLPADTAPDPSETEHVWPEGWVRTVTS